MIQLARSTPRHQVLVVGAGAVGLFAALRLCDAGVEVRIIDGRLAGNHAPSSILLHRQSARLLADLGLGTSLWRGMTIPEVDVYVEHEQRATFDLSAASVSRGVMTLPEELLEQLLERELARRGVNIEWDARLSSLSQRAESVTGQITRYDARGARADSSAFEVEYVIGADGAESTVRKALGIELLPRGPVEQFVSLDARLAQPLGPAGVLSFERDAAHSAYPLREGDARFTFQMAGRPRPLAGPQLLRALLSAHFPWLSNDVEVCSSGRVHSHQRALASSFGVGRVWLAGDAVHGTSPLGGQDLNLGLSEANELSVRMVEVLKRARGQDFGQRYSASRLRQWHELLSLDAPATASSRVPSWTRAHAARLLPALPASERDLEAMLRELTRNPSSNRPSLVALP